VSETDHISTPPGRPQRQPLLTSSVVIYGTLILLALTIPRALVNWSKNFEPNPIQMTMLRVAEAVFAASHGAGLDRPFLAGRALFLKVTGKEED
jgi:hypothetical protein